jgi:hypothetical protein
MLNMTKTMGSGCLKELLALSLLLDTKGTALAATGVNSLFWPTSLKASAKFTVSGSRNPAAQRVVFTIEPADFPVRQVAFFHENQQVVS